MTTRSGGQTAAYVRVSTNGQSLDSQRTAIEGWAATHGIKKLAWYQDVASGAATNRPGWQRLEAAIRTGKVRRLIVFRLDRLGRTTVGLVNLLALFREHDVRLVSVSESLDLDTPAGRLVASILASIAAFERELIRERVRAGLAAARARGKRIGGSKPGPRKLNDKTARTLKRLVAAGVPQRERARVLGLSRMTCRKYERLLGLVG